MFPMPSPSPTLDELREKLKDWPGRPQGLSPNPVLGEGNPNAQVMFIGEAPGEQEDKQGRPFVGQAGKMLDELLKTIGLARTDVYISNVVKYRPPGNRDPTDEEKAACMPWLQLEIAAIRPAVIVPLGRHALGHFFVKGSISAMHGKPQKLTDNVTVFPIYHPAAALHNPGLRQALADDFLALGAFLKEKAIAVTPAKD
jgi:DNA polymerase